MPIEARPARDLQAHQLDCARRVVAILFEKTGLSSIARCTPMVIVGGGNWISFSLDHTVSTDSILGLLQRDGKPAFVPDVLNRKSGVRSRTSPSLHLTNLGSGNNLVGHVDAYYYVKSPIGHAGEFLRKKTSTPSRLLKRLLNPT
jgi:hypothetical protein